MHALHALLQPSVLPEQVTQRLAWTLVHFVWQGAAVVVLFALTLWLGRVRRPSTRYAFGLIALAAMAACPVVTFGLIRPELRSDATIAEPSDQTKVAIIAPRDEPFENGRPITEGSSRGAVMATLKDHPHRDSRGFATEASGLEILEPQSPMANAADAASQWPVSSLVAFAHEATPARASWLRVQPWIVSGWLFGVALLSLRLLLGWLGVWRLRRRVEPVPEWLAERAQCLAEALRVTRPLIHLSQRVTEAVAVGFLKPMILLPVAWVTELPPDMIEAVIAHELAHIRRGDLWVNLLQRLVETLLFYHPAVWWLSRRLRIDRELCCDELAVATTQNRVRYAETLEHIGRLSLADTLGRAHPPLHARTTLTVSIGSPPSILLNRIRAILTPPQQDRSTTAWLAGLIPLVIACLVGWSLISRNAAPASDEPQPINSPSATGGSSEPPVRSSRDDENTGGPKRPPVAPAVEMPASSNDIRPNNLVEAAGTYRGRIVTEDGSPLPPDLKLMRRVSSEQTRETPVDPNGEFSFGTDPKHGSVRFSMTATGFAPFDSSWLKLDQPLALTLSRGAVVKLRLVPPAGSGPVAGTAALIVPWWDEDEQGTFPVDANGIVTIARCPKATVKIDVLVPGFEEVRVHRWVRGDVSLDVPLTPAKPTRLRIVSAKDRSPIAGAKVRLFSRTRAGSFLTPFQYWGDGPVWGESNADGRVELTTLRAVDPVPTNDPGAAVYAFRIDAPNHASCYIGDVRAGSDFGEIQVGDSLEVRGEIVRDAAMPERISLQIRQPTVAQGGGNGRGGWKNINLNEVEGKLTFHLTGLQAGPFDMFIVYSDASEPPNSPRGTIKQLQFHGLLTGSSSNLVITRESVVPGDKLLTARRTTLFPIDDHPPSNVPGNVVKQLAGGLLMVSEDEGITVLTDNRPTRQPLFVWSSTAPVQHSMGHIKWRVFVLQDGTVFIPGGQNHEAGTHHKLPASELQELKSLLEKHRDLFGKQAPKELPQFAGWRHGHENLSYTKDGETKTFVKWYGLEQPPLVGEFDTAGPHKEIIDFVIRLKTDAACGGRKAKAKYRELANKALTAVLPKATPFNEATWTNTVNGTDGTRTIRFANTTERTEVTLIHPAFGEVYVERVEHLDKRLAFDAALSAAREKSDDEVEVRKESDPKIDNQDAERLAIERAVGFLKSRQHDAGTWDESGAQVEGTTVLATVALLQAGAKTDEAVIQKALPTLRKIEPKMIYVVALQTMALCIASPKEDAELIRRNVEWIENAQVKEGDATGGWSYAGTPTRWADGSCSRFAVLGLDAAKRAKFEVRAETWQRVTTYWLKSQQENGCWGYVSDSRPTFSMTLAGVSGLATAHRHLPKDEHVAAREAAMRKPHEFIAKTIPSIKLSWPFYSFHCLERAGHLTDTVRFGDVDWKSVVTKRLLDAQRGDGAWGQPSATENELIATSFALMFLSGRPEDRGDGKADGTEKPLDPDQREMRIKPRGGKGATFNVTSHTTQDVPPLQETLLDGGIEIEVVEGNGAQLRLQADRAIIQVEANDQTNLFDGRSAVTSLLELRLAGKVTLEFVRQPGAKPFKLQAERLWVDLAKHHVKGEKISLIREGGSPTIDWDEFDLPTGPPAKVPLTKQRPPGATGGSPEPTVPSPAENKNTGSPKPLPVAPGAEPKSGQTGHGVQLAVRGRVMIDGPIPEVPPLKIKPSFHGIIPRNPEESLRNKQREKEAPVVEIPDDSLVLSKDGGVANVAIYLKKAPRDGKHSDPPSEPVVIEAVEYRFSPHMSFIRAGQSLSLKNSMNEAANFHSHPLRGTPQNQLLNFGGDLLIKSPYTQSEPLPHRFASDIRPWMNGYLLAQDHPFAAITDADGRFEIRDLPPGEHHFTVWHERRGYLNKDLVVRVEDDKVSEVDLKFTVEQLQRLDLAGANNKDMAKPRAERLKANDREAAAKLVGRWMLTLPAGFVFEAEAELTKDGCLKFSGKRGNNVFGKYAVRGDRMELVEPTDNGMIDLVWQVKSNNLLTLIVDENKVGGTYLGAKLERLAEAPQKDEENKDRLGSARSDSVFRIPAQAVEQAKRLAAEARSKRTSLKQRRPAGLEDLDSAEAIQRAAEQAMKELADEKTNYPALLRLEYLGDAAFETIVAGTKSENPLVARSSCRALLRRGKKAVAPLCEIIDSADDLGVRSVAIETVGQTFDAEAVPTLIRALEVKELRVDAMSALQYIRDPRAIEPLKKLVAIGGIGHAAEQAIKHIESPQGYAWCPPESRDLLQLCHDAHTLKGETYGPDELKRIIEGLTSDSYWSLSALGSLDSTEAVPAIIAVPLSESKFQFLAGIGTPAALEHIIERLHSLNPRTRELAIEGMANGGGRWAAPLLIALLDDPSLTIPEMKDENDPLGLNDGRRNPLNNWPESHEAHSALYLYFSRFGMNGQTRNLYLGESNDVREEIKQTKTWWKEHGDDFLTGRIVPNPNLTSVWYNH